MNEWIDIEINKPEVVKNGQTEWYDIKIDNKNEAIGVISDNSWRTCWLIRDTSGLFWRNMTRNITHWRKRDKC